MINRFDIVKEKVSGIKMQVVDVINKGDHDERYKAKYFDNGEFKFVSVEAQEIELLNEEKKVGFQNGK